MPNFILLTTVFLFLCVYIIQVEMQMMPDYGQDEDDYRDPEKNRPDKSPDYDQEDDDYQDPDRDPDRPDPRRMKRRGRRPPRHPDYDRGMPARANEVVVGQKRFKLYEKKRLGYQKAKEFCTKKQGRIVRLRQIQAVKKLDSLFLKARMMGKDLWIGMQKKMWKQHMKQIAQKASWPEGEIEKMCPAIGMSSKGLEPVECEKPMPFICMYHRNRPRTTRKPKRKENSTAEANVEGMEDIDKWRDKIASKKDEMKK